MLSLKFGQGNAKLSVAISTFSLPAGHSCPFAKECYSKANQLTGKIIDGQHCKFRCFAASQEALYPTVRKARWHNFNALLSSPSVRSKAELINNSLPDYNEKVRVHVSGDFYNEDYFLAWLNVAKNRPNNLFYGYTKALRFLVKYRKITPDNFRFTASKGGTHDLLIEEHNLKYAEVVFSVEEAERKGLEIDHDDSHAIQGNKSFALLLHGRQPKGTVAGEALNKLRRLNLGGYSRHKKAKKKLDAIKIFIFKKGGVKCKKQSLMAAA